MKNRFWFRAWDIVKKEMIQNVGVYNGKFVGEMDTQNNWHKFNNNGEDRFVLMQSTGLNVNGKLLFEGDIVFVKDRNEYFVVVWKENFAEFWLVNIYKIDEAANILFGSDNREIVGNIYENKDMLEKQKG